MSVGNRTRRVAFLLISAHQPQAPKATKFVPAHVCIKGAIKSPTWEEHKKENHKGRDTTTSAQYRKTKSPIQQWAK